MLQTQGDGSLPALNRMNQISDRIRQYTDQTKTERDTIKADVERNIRRLEDQQQKQQLSDRNAFS